eukprot:TRINITY_DN2477_c0_g1_i1.p1 TRINITY_DN2477_c0_g1~~TRINITY_DN2477_c0_g1_i1.p1  ORF type:complete len:565 (+),score=167.22 TRINITY_DN2477_c0_g1_i1:171-1865(+)
MKEMKQILFDTTFKNAHPVWLLFTLVIATLFSPVFQVLVLRLIMVKDTFCSGCGTFPFFYVALYSFPVFLISVIYFFVGTLKGKFSMSIRFPSYFWMSACGAAGHLLQAYALSGVFVTASRFSMAFVIDLLLILPVGALVLRKWRPGVSRHWTLWFVGLASLIPFALFWFVKASDGSTETNVPETDDYKYVICAILSRLFFLTRNIVMKRAVLKEKKLAATEAPLSVFAQMDELFSLKVGLLLESPVFDTKFFGPTTKLSFQGHMLGTALFLCPAAWIASMFNEELPTAFDEFMSMPMVLLVLFGYMPIAQFMEHVFTFPMLIRGSANSATFATVLQILVAVYVSNMYSDLKDELTTAQSIGLTLMVLVMFAFSHVASRRRKNDNFNRDVKGLYGTVRDFGEEDERHLRSVSRALGVSAASRAVAHIAVTRNSKAHEKLERTLTMGALKTEVKSEASHSEETPRADRSVTFRKSSGGASAEDSEDGDVDMDDDREALGQIAESDDDIVSQQGDEEEDAPIPHTPASFLIRGPSKKQVRLVHEPHPEEEEQGEAFHFDDEENYKS